MVNSAKSVDWPAVEAQVRGGSLICIYDFPDREGETDVACIGRSADAQTIDFMRRQVGGIQTVYVSGAIMARLTISTYTEFVLQADSATLPTELVKMGRAHDPRFAITIDAKDNQTGCSPVEAAHTIQLLYDLVRDASSMTDQALRAYFTGHFVAPGHVSLIRGAEALLRERNGHAELSLALAKAFGFPEIATACELINPATLKSMTLDDARAFAADHKIPFVTGNDILAFTASSVHQSS